MSTDSAQRSSRTRQGSHIGRGGCSVINITITGSAIESTRLLSGLSAGPCTVMAATSVDGVREPFDCASVASTRSCSIRCGLRGLGCPDGRCFAVGYSLFVQVPAGEPLVRSCKRCCCCGRLPLDRVVEVHVAAGLSTTGSTSTLMPVSLSRPCWPSSQGCSRGSPTCAQSCSKQSPRACCTSVCRASGMRSPTSTGSLRSPAVTRPRATANTRARRSRRAHARSSLLMIEPTPLDANLHSSPRSPATTVRNRAARASTRFDCSPTKPGSGDHGEPA